MSNTPAAPAGATRMGPRCADPSNPPADCTYWAWVGEGNDATMVYNDKGCDYCDSEWAMVKMHNHMMDMHQYWVASGLNGAYDMARWGRHYKSGSPKGSPQTKALVRSMMTKYGQHKRYVNVCVACEASGAYHHEVETGVPGEDCVTDEAYEAAKEMCRTWGAWDGAEDKAWTCKGKYWVHNDSHGPCPY